MWGGRESAANWGLWLVTQITNTNTNYSQYPDLAKSFQVNIENKYALSLEDKGNIHKRCKNSSKATISVLEMSFMKQF